MSAAPSRSTARATRIRGSGAAAAWRVRLDAALLGLLVSPAALSAQGRLVRGDFAMTLTQAGAPARVVVRYVVRPASDTASLPLVAIPFGTSIQDLNAAVDGVPSGMVVDTLAGGTLRGMVRLLPGAAGRDVQVSLAYGVVGAWPADEERVRAPVLALTWPPAAALHGTFRGTITLPANHLAYDAFPSTLRLDATGGTRWSFDLQVVPSVVTLAVAAQRRPMVPLATAVEGAALGLLVLFAVYGWRRFRVEG